MSCKLCQAPLLGRQRVCAECKLVRERERYAARPPEWKAARTARAIERRNADIDAARSAARKRYERNRKYTLEVNREYLRKRFFSARAYRLKGEGRATAKELASLWKVQSGRCALSGRNLDRSAQLDHITPRSRGGTDAIGNLRWTHDLVNMARRALSDAEFLQLCKDVVETASRADLTPMRRAA